jgi:hypothetical protein
VCYEAIASDVASTPCGHSFHQVCLDTWLARANTCPSCRTVVASAPTDPQAEPVWYAWFDERHRATGERLQESRRKLDAIAAGLEAVKVALDACATAEAAKRAKRSAAAKRAAATRAANRRALVVV